MLLVMFYSAKKAALDKAASEAKLAEDLAGLRCVCWDKLTDQIYFKKGPFT